MNLVIVIAGVAGLAVAAYGFVALAVDAWRRRQYGDVVLAAAAVVAVAAGLLFYGDRLLR